MGFKKLYFESHMFNINIIYIKYIIFINFNIIVINYLGVILKASKSIYINYIKVKAILS